MVQISSTITQTGSIIYFKVKFPQIRLRSNYLFETTNRLGWGLETCGVTHMTVSDKTLGVYVLNMNVGHFNTSRCKYVEVFFFFLSLRLFFVHFSYITWPRKKFFFWKNISLLKKDIKIAQETKSRSFRWKTFRQSIWLESRKICNSTKAKTIFKIPVEPWAFINLIKL